MAEEKGMSVDMDAFEACMAEQRERSRAAGKTGGGPSLKFEAEATAHLRRSGVPVTDDSPKSAFSLRQRHLCAHDHDKEAHAHLHLLLLTRQGLGF
jgi:alanyl-tRNA synthetase